MTFKTYGLKTLTLLFLCLSLITCDSSNTTNEPDINLLGSTTVDGYTIELYSSESLITGANTLFWQIKQNNTSIDVESIQITPMMDMGMMKHSTPFTQPEESEAFPSYFTNDATFIMASGEMGSWSIEFSVRTKNNVEINGEIPIEVSSSWHLTSVKSSSDQMYFISWSTPRNPVNGSNDVALMLYKRESMMNFPMVTDANITIYPYMDMGSGQGHSTSFTEPVPTAEGKYMGNITYSMSGIWTTTVTVVTAQNDTLPDVVFEYNVQAK